MKSLWRYIIALFEEDDDYFAENRDTGVLMHYMQPGEVTEPPDAQQAFGDTK